MRVAAGQNLVLGDQALNRMTLDSAGNAAQPTAAGGFVKAMMWVQAGAAPYSILGCFNSTLTGAAATTPPCGINFTEDAQGPGHWDFDPGFSVAGRFFSATLTYIIGAGEGSASCIAAYPGNDTVYVQTSDCNGNARTGDFYLLIY